jgi:prepilin signal peptidase PulO-like enzyme (type II secretory pathway)
VNESCHNTNACRCASCVESINIYYDVCVLSMLNLSLSLHMLHCDSCIEFVNILQTICVTSLLTRATKHLYKVYMQGVEMMNLSAAISHFLNCYLGSFPTPHTQAAVEETVSMVCR